MPKKQSSTVVKKTQQANKKAAKKASSASNKVRAGKPKPKKTTASTTKKTVAAKKSVTKKKPVVKKKKKKKKKNNNNSKTVSKKKTVQKKKAKKAAAPKKKTPKQIPVSESESESESDFGGGMSEEQKQRVRDLFKKFQAANEDQRRPALYLKLEEYSNPTEGINDRFASKLGGHPFWPVNEGPKYSREHSIAKDNSSKTESSTLFMGDLRLLAQFNLKDIRSDFRRQLSLPDEDGILQFYVSPNDCWGLFAKNAGYQNSTTYRVKYWPAEVVSRTTQCLSADHFPPVIAQQKDDPFNHHQELPFSTRKPLRIIFEKELRSELWGVSNYGGEGSIADKFAEFLQKEAPELDPEVVCDDLGDILWDGHSADPSGSKLGGHPAFTQDDPRDSWKQEDKSLLFQLDSQGPIMIGDMGVMNFFNADRSTANGDFGETKYTWDCG